MLLDIGSLMSSNEPTGAFLLSMVNGQDLDEEVANGGTCTITFVVNTDGSMDAGAADETPTLTGQTWWSPIGTTDGTGVHVKLSYSSGTNQYSSGSGLGTWLACTTQRSWTFTKAAEPSGDPDQTNGVYLLEFSLDGGSTTEASATLDDISLIEAAA